MYSQASEVNVSTPTLGDKERVGCGGELLIGYEFMGEKVLLKTIIEIESSQ
jgi:hypothetical protein